MCFLRKKSTFRPKVRIPVSYYKIFCTNNYFAIQSYVTKVKIILLRDSSAVGEQMFGKSTFPHDPQVRKSYIH